MDNKVEEEPVEETAKQEIDEQEQATAQAAQYLDQLQRTQAEFANYKKRIERERGEFVSLANAALITKMLPILDDFERALKTIPENLQGLTWVEGMILIERRLRMTLEQEGLAEIDAVGQAFDPELHHAVVREETKEYEEDKVVGELQKGYRLNDKVLRPSMVRVATKPSKNNKEEPE